MGISAASWIQSGRGTGAAWDCKGECDLDIENHCHTGFMSLMIAFSYIQELHFFKSNQHVFFFF